MCIILLKICSFSDIFVISFKDTIWSNVSNLQINAQHNHNLLSVLYVVTLLTINHLVSLTVNCSFPHIVCDHHYVSHRVSVGADTFVWCSRLHFMATDWPMRSWLRGALSSSHHKPLIMQYPHRSYSSHMSHYAIHTQLSRLFSP